MCALHKQRGAYQLAPVFISSLNLARRDLTDGTELGASPLAAGSLHRAGCEDGRGLINDRAVNSHWVRKVLMSFLKTHGASSLSYSFPAPSGTESFAGVGLVLFWGIGAQVYGGALTWISRKKKSHRVMTDYV